LVLDELLANVNPPRRPRTSPRVIKRIISIAELLGDVTLVATYRQLARWTEREMIKRVRTGRYAAITHMTNPLHDLRKR
jgi:hypothetical protein